MRNGSPGPGRISRNLRSRRQLQAASIIPLSNVEAQRATLSTEEKHEQLEGLEKKLSLDGKRAGTPCIKMPLHLYAERWRCPIAGNPTLAYYVAFGAHGSHAPTSKPGDSLKIFGYTMALVGVTGVIKEFGTAAFRGLNTCLFFDATV